MEAEQLADVPCDHCGARRALVRCAAHAARLCLPCDVAAHAAAPAHQRAPLCDACHAASAVARCDDHGGAALCAACARGAPCHGLRAAAAYTGFPDLPTLARVLSVDGGYNIHLIAESSSGTTGTAIQQAAITVLDHNGSDVNTIAMGSTEPFATNPHSSNSVDTPMGHMEGTFKEPSSLDFDDRITSSWSELVMPSPDAHPAPPLTKNSTPSYTTYEYDELSMMGTGTMNDVAALDMPMSVSGSSGVIDGQDEEPPPPMNSEERKEQQEKRRLAKKRYNEKKKNRRYTPTFSS